MEIGLCQDEWDFINFIEESIKKLEGKAVFCFNDAVIRAHDDKWSVRMHCG